MPLHVVLMLVRWSPRSLRFLLLRRRSLALGLRSFAGLRRCCVVFGGVVGGVLVRRRVVFTGKVHHRITALNLKVCVDRESAIDHHPLAVL